MVNKNSRTKNSALSLITGIGGQVLNETLRFITRTIFIYTLGKMFLGINGLFSEIMVMLSLTNLGVGTAIIYRLYKPIAENDEHQVRILLKFYRKAYHVIALIILIIGLCLLPFLDVIIKDYNRLGAIGLNAEFVYILFLGQSIVSYLFYAYRNCVFAADQKQYIINAVNIVVSIITAIIQIAVLCIFKDFITYLVVGILDGIIKNLVVAILTYKQYPAYFKKESDSLPKAEIKTMFKDCGALLVFRINGVVQKSTGNFILSAFIGLAVVGLYSNYLVIYTSIRTLSNQLFSAIRGSMGNLFASNASIDDKYKFFEVMNFITMLIFGTCGTTLCININELMYCWIGEDYLIPQPFPLLLGIEVLIMGLVLNLNQIRTVTGLFRQMWTRPIFSMIANLVVTLIAVQKIGVFAIPLGYIVSISCTNLVADPYVIHKYGFMNDKKVSDYYLKNIKYLTAVICGGACSYFINSNLFTNINWLTLISHTLITVLCTVLFFILFFNNTNEYRYLYQKMVKIKH